MYAAMYADAMRRTNIYLTEVEQRALDAKAAVEGCSRSDLVRAVIDRELDLDDDAEVDAILSELAAELAETARQLAEDDPDLRVQ